MVSQGTSKDFRLGGQTELTIQLTIHVFLQENKKMEIMMRDQHQVALALALSLA